MWNIYYCDLPVKIILECSILPLSNMSENGLIWNCSNSSYSQNLNYILAVRTNTVATLDPVSSEEGCQSLQRDMEALEEWSGECLSTWVSALLYM